MTYIGDSEFQTGLGIKWDNPVVGHVQYGRDDLNLVMFYKRSCFNQVASTQAGRRIYEDKNYIKIQQPGDKTTVIDRPVQHSDAQRWPHQWEQFSKDETQTPIGTPIGLLFPRHPSIEDNLRAIGIMTVEQLANLNDTGIAAIGMGGLDYVNFAKQYLDQANRGVPFHKFQSEMEQKDRQIESLTNQVNTLVGQMTGMQEQYRQAMLGGMMGQSQAPYTPPAQVVAAVRPVGLPPVPASFDPQTTQINANHPSTAAAAPAPKRRGRPPRPKAAPEAPTDVA